VKGRIGDWLFVSIISIISSSIVSTYMLQLGNMYITLGSLGTYASSSSSVVVCLRQHLHVAFSGPLSGTKERISST
jgi:hypothetical protein